jgi:hypothetical protein
MSNTHETNTQPIGPEAAPAPLNFLELVEVEESTLGSVALLHSSQAQTFHREAADSGVFHQFTLDLSTASGIERPGHAADVTQIVAIMLPATSQGTTGARSTSIMLRFPKSSSRLEASRFEQDETGAWHHIQTLDVEKDDDLRVPKGSGILYGVVDDSVDWRAKNHNDYRDSPRLQTLLQLVKLSNESPLRETHDAVQRTPRRGFLQWLVTRRNA